MKKYITVLFLNTMIINLNIKTRKEVCPNDIPTRRNEPHQ